MIGIYIGLISNKLHFKKPMTWFGGLIQRFTGSKWNHAVIFLNLWGLNIVIHSQAWVRLELYKTWLGKADRDIALYEVLGKPDTEWLFTQLNTLYDAWGIVCFAYSIIVSKITGQKKWYGVRGTKADRNFFCSELVVRFLGVENAWFAPSEIPDLEKQGLIAFLGYYKTKKGSNRLIDDQAPTPSPLQMAA